MALNIIVQIYLCVCIIFILCCIKVYCLDCYFSHYDSPTVPLRSTDDQVIRYIDTLPAYSVPIINIQITIPPPCYETSELSRYTLEA